MPRRNEDKRAHAEWVIEQNKAHEEELNQRQHADLNRMIEGSFQNVPRDKILDLAEGIGKNPLVQSIDLRNLGLGAEFARRLTESLRVHANTTLTQISMASCNLGDDGFAVLADHIKEFPTIKVLGVSGNHLKTDSIKKLCNLIASPGCPLEYIDIEYATIGQRMAEKLYRCLFLNITVRQIKLYSTGLDKSEIARIEKIIDDRIERDFEVSHTLHKTLENTDWERLARGLKTICVPSDHKATTRAVIQRMKDHPKFPGDSVFKERLKDASKHPLCTEEMKALLLSQ